MFPSLICRLHAKWAVQDSEPKCWRKNYQRYAMLQLASNLNFPNSAWIHPIWPQHATATYIAPSWSSCGCVIPVLPVIGSMRSKRRSKTVPSVHHSTWVGIMVATLYSFIFEPMTISQWLIISTSPLFLHLAHVNASSSALWTPLRCRHLLADRQDLTYDLTSPTQV